MSTPDDSIQPIDGRGEDKASPLVRRLFFLLRDRPFIDRQHVYLALVEHFPMVPGSPRQTLALDALRVCVRETGIRRPSRGTFDAWRNSLDDKEAFVSSNRIRSAFGGWNAALAALGAAPAHDVASRRLTSTGGRPSYTREGLLATLQAWARELGPHPAPSQLTAQAFRAWAREKKKDPTVSLQLPLSNRPWRKTLGGWHEALAAAGLLSRRAGGATSSTKHMGSPRAYSEEEMMRWLREAAREVGRVPTRKAYDRFARARRAAAAVHDKHCPVPMSETIAARFTWGEALRRAGLITRAQMNSDLGGSAVRFTEADLVDALTEAIRAHGGPVRISDYRRWREDRLDELGRRDRGERRLLIPSDGSIRMAFGRDWKAALLEAYAKHSGLPGKPPADDRQPLPSEQAEDAKQGERPEHPGEQAGVRQRGCRNKARELGLLAGERQRPDTTSSDRFDSGEEKAA